MSTAVGADYRTTLTITHYLRTAFAAAGVPLDHPPLPNPQQPQGDRQQDQDNDNHNQQVH
jgi:hypothetical protein